MNCIYNYKGHTFQSELELDDYLLEKRKFETKHKDLVFSKKTPALKTLDIITTSNEQAEILKKNGTIIVNPDGKNDIEPTKIDGKGHIGVTDFLMGLTNIEGNLLFPEFIESNYWATVKPRWAGGNFDEDEKTAIFGENEEVKPIVGDEEFEIARKIIEDKWKQQGKIGSELHKIMQKYFSKSNTGKPIREMDDDFLINSYLPSVINTDLVSSKTIAETVKYCRDLEETFKKELGDNLIYLPEVTLSGVSNQLDDSGNPKTLIGVVDLIVIDNEGTPHIVDYKTSPHPYIGSSTEAGYADAKVLTFKYQLGVYDRLLRKNGINTSRSKLFVAPIKLLDFKREGDKWNYSGIEEYSGQVEELTKDIKTNLNIQENIDEFLPAPFITSATTDNLLQNVTNVMGKWFPKFNSTPETITDEMIFDELKKQNCEVPNPESGKFIYKFKNRGNLIKADSYEDLFAKVKKRFISYANNRVNLTQSIKEGLISAIKDENPNYEFTKASTPSDPEGVTNFFQQRLGKYCNGNWSVMDCEPAEYLGCILIRNNFNNQIDVVKISTNFLKGERELIKGRKGLSGAFESDIRAQNKPHSLMLQSVNGNIELMEAMLVLNNMTDLFKENAIVGDVAVYNPYSLDGVSADNKQLLYCFNQLDKFESVGINNFKDSNPSVKMANRYDLFYNRFIEIMSEVNDDNKLSKSWKRFTKCTSDLDACIGDPTSLRLELMHLRKEMQKAFPTIANDSQVTDTTNIPQLQVYQMLNTAIGQLNGLDYPQQLFAHDKWLESINIFRRGVASNNLDNPGNLKSPILNKLTSLVTIAYQNVRDTVNRSQGEIRNLVNDLKKEQGFSYLKERTFGNQSDLYKRMIEYTDDGDILLKNPDSPESGLSTAERNFLRYFLKTINDNRFSNKTPEEIDELRLSGSTAYYRLPLTPGNIASMSSAQGLLSIIKDKCKDWMPEEAKKRAINKIEGFLDPEDEKVKKIDKGNLWEMTNTFDVGEDKRRLDLIEDHGIGYFENNLETLLLKHITAYSTKEHLDEVFPSLQALAIHLSSQGAIQNTKFVDDMQYLNDYIKNKIFNRSLIPEKYKGLSIFVGHLKSFASKMALAFTPVQLYQGLDGIWKDISLVIRKPDGGTAFNKENVIAAYKFICKDYFHYSNVKSISELMNEVYGLNDMDMNTYADKIKSDQSGVWNFWALAFRFATRPDFYNRLTIFGAQMRGDGCWDAHSVVNGKLVYTMSKDSRFNLLEFKNGQLVSKDDAKYKEQQSLYYATANQMVRENTRNADGSIFRVGQALPKAYTVQQSESHKALADSIYGYYSHEKKSMFQSTLIGGLFFQMCTYWSSKKNQYLGSEGIKLQGKLVQYEEDGKKIFYKLNKNGEVTEELTTENTGFPCYQWEGRWEEGIMLTLSKSLLDLWGGVKQGNIREGYKTFTNDIWNNSDENLRRAYRSNLKQLFYDLFMFLFMGVLVSGSIAAFVKDDVKERGDDSIDKIVVNSTLGLGSKILTNSTYDFNALESIAGRGINWTPFSIQTITATAKNFSSVITGDKSLYQGLVNSVAATRATKPFWNFIDPTKIEDEK